MEILTSKFDEQLQQVRRFAKENGIRTPGINKLSNWLSQHYLDYTLESWTEISSDNRSYFFVMNEIYDDINNKLEHAKNNNWVKVIDLNYPFVRLNIAFK